MSSAKKEAEMAKKTFELENEIAEEEIYEYSEDEQDLIYEKKPWK
jgi:hypothetical protein